MLCAAEPTVRGCSTGGSTGCTGTVVGGVTVNTCQCADSRCNNKVVAPGGTTSRPINDQSKAAQPKAAHSAITYAAAAMFAVVVIRSA